MNRCGAGFEQNKIFMWFMSFSRSLNWIKYDDFIFEQSEMKNGRYKTPI